MNKLVLATAVAGIMTAASASAATIYEGNGIKYDLKGDLQVQLRKDSGDDQDTHIEFDDLELKNTIAYDLGNEMKAFGQVDFSFNSSADKGGDGAALEEAYLGLQVGNVAVSIGKQDLAVDDFGIENQYEDHIGDQTQFSSTTGDDIIRIDYTGEGFTVAASTLIKADSETTDTSSVDGFDVLASTAVAGVELAVAYQDYNDEYSAWGVSAAFDAGFAAFGIDYSSADIDATDDTNSTYGLVAIVPVAATTDLSVGYTSIDNDSADDVAGWYANIGYKFPTQKNVSLFAEVSDTDKADTDIGMLVGMRIKF